MKEPPAECQVSSVGLKIVSVCLIWIIIIMVLKANRRLLDATRGKRYHAREITPPAKKIELNSSEKSEQGESVD